MTILIEGMEMPKEGFVEILIRDDGTVQQTGQSYRIDGTDYYTPYIGKMPVVYKAVPVPPHGRLIDADKLHIESYSYNEPDGGKTQFNFNYVPLSSVKYAPTIIPASEEEET